MWLTALSAIPADNFPGTVARTGVTIRRPQAFFPPEGTDVDWALIRVSDGSVLQSGATTAGPEALVTVDGLIVYPDPERVKLTLTVPVTAVSTRRDTQLRDLSAWLRAVAPNPFTRGVTVGFTLSKASRVALRVHDVAGRLVRNLVDGIELPAGEHSVHWDGAGPGIGRLPSGVYHVILHSADGTRDVKRLVRLD